MKALGARPADRLEGRGQSVLSRVLLHVIEPARPLDDALDQRARLERTIDHVHDALILMVDHVEHRASAQGAEIVRLSAARRVEGGPGERNLEPAVPGRAGRHLRFEFGQIGVGVVDAFGHAGTRAAVSHGRVRVCSLLMEVSCANSTHRSSRSKTAS
jgi:hypothetical protein